MISGGECDNLIDSCVYYCKGAKFRENSPELDNYVKLNLMRGFTSQLTSFSYLVADNEVTYQFLNENLRKYSELVDSKNGVNNYFELIQGLAKFVKNAQCYKWKSSLQANFNHKLQEFLQSLSTRDCQNVLKGCGNEQEITEKDIDLLCRSASVVHSEVSANTLTSVGRQDCQYKKNDYSPKSHFSEKRKNFLTEHPTNVLKNRRMEEDNYTNKTLTSGKEVASVAGNKLKTLLQEQESSKSSLASFLKFRTASAELKAQNVKKYGAGKGRTNEFTDDNLQLKKSLGSRPRSVTSKFVIPLKSNNKNNQMAYEQENIEVNANSQEEIDPRLQHIDRKMIEMIRSEIIDSTNPLTWDDIAGLQFAKSTIQEIVVWPMLRPDIFTGLRRPPKGILLFGPPGTGKTLIAKCIASQSKSTFFSISASSLTSKWIGDGEKMVRALFAVARVDQPSVVFIDEIDSLLSKRSDTEHESSRRIKTEFLVQLDGAATGEEDRVLIIGATNRPQELDEAARRRLVKRLYIPLPEHKARIEMVTRLMSKEKNNLTAEEIKYVADLTDGYSGADMKILCQEAALGPIRSISYSQIECISSEEVRPVTIDDFKAALGRVRSSVSPADLQNYTDWDKTYGSGSV